MRGSLPWQGLNAKTKDEKYSLIKNKKINTSFEALCKGFPEEFVTYFNYCHKLQFEEKPDYEYLKKLFKTEFDKKGYVNDGVYDWVLLKRVANDGILFIFLIIYLEKNQKANKGRIKENSSALEKFVATGNEWNAGKRVTTGYDFYANF